MKSRIILPVVATIGFLLLGAAPAAALPACGYSKKCVTTYYTDASHSPQGVVGMKGVLCGNIPLSWGVVTPHSTFQATTCLN